MFQLITSVDGRKDVIEGLEQGEKSQICKCRTNYLIGSFRKIIPFLEKKYKLWRRKCPSKHVLKRARVGSSDFIKGISFTLILIFRS